MSAVRSIVITIAVVALQGCVMIDVTPEAPEQEPPGGLSIRADVRSPILLVPRTLEHQEGAEVIAEYRLRTSYDTSPDFLEWVSVFNVLTLFGCPTGCDSVAVTGEMTLKKGDEILGEYAATADVGRLRSLYYFSDFSTLRLAGLRAIRDRIEDLMQADPGLKTLESREGK